MTENEEETRLTVSIWKKSSSGTWLHQREVCDVEKQKLTGINDERIFMEIKT